mmetsp:Transcript_11040/g.12138  ORF Transcript_11040/g.12138 Transcript_11040/m.12138 type:complete len:157 (-) Transcript_11040:18-488(-)
MSTESIIMPPKSALLLFTLVALVTHFFIPIYALPPLGVLIRVAIAFPLFAGFIAWKMTFMKIFSRNSTSFNHEEKTTKLMTSGFYAACRNPMYLVDPLPILGIGEIFNTAWSVVACILMMSYLHFHVIPKEEILLLKMFGEDYKKYMDTVPRWGIF